MRIFLQRASDYYDYIIIDTPPINIVTDVAVMSDSISGVVLVTSHGKTTIDDVKKASVALEKVNAKLLGMVVAGVKKKLSSYKKDKVSSYYQSDDDDM